MFSFFTPGIGIEDVEAKIAYGLSYLTLKSIREQEEKLTLNPLRGYYEIRVNDEYERLEKIINREFKKLCDSDFTEDELRSITGVQPKYVHQYADEFTMLQKKV